MRSDSVKNMSAYADQNHAPSLAAARLEQKSLACQVIWSLSYPWFDKYCYNDDRVKASNYDIYGLLCAMLSHGVFLITHHL